ncbi:MAG: hypothetical protein IKR38_03030 [Bacteroidales bacterium]|nr:hypothetical protein [Bacteroidales bacterium]
MKKDYVTLFNERKWKDAFEAMPLNVQKAVKVSPGDVQTIRVRASEFNKESETRRVSVSVDYSESIVMVKVMKKN